jgi:hypothetical protein
LIGVVKLQAVSAGLYPTWKNGIQLRESKIYYFFSIKFYLGQTTRSRDERQKQGEKTGNLTTKNQCIKKFNFHQGFEPVLIFR